jgi:hypothetical protein
MAWLYLAVPSSGAQVAFAQERRLGDGPQHACWFGVHSVADGHRSKKPGAGVDRSLRPGHAVRQR